MVDAEGSDIADQLAHLFGSPPATPARATPTGVPAKPGSLAAATLAVDPAVLAVCGVVEMEQQVLAILSAAYHRPVAELVAEEAAPDGGVLIDSMSAVFVYSLIHPTFGGRSLRALSAAGRPTDFVSTRAFAALLVRVRDSQDLL